jgi:uncharacterized protein with HEPN domain
LGRLWYNKRSQHNLRWDDIAGIGNILRHDYQHVDGTIIWRAVKNHLAPLKEALPPHQINTQAASLKDARPRIGKISAARAFSER